MTDFFFFFGKLGYLRSSKNAHMKASEMPEANQFILTLIDFLNEKSNEMRLKGTVLKRPFNNRKLLIILCVKTGRRILVNHNLIPEEEF